MHHPGLVQGLSAREAKYLGAELPPCKQWKIRALADYCDTPHRVYEARHAFGTIDPALVLGKMLPPPNPATLATLVPVLTAFEISQFYAANVDVCFLSKLRGSLMYVCDVLDAYMLVAPADVWHILYARREWVRALLRADGHGIVFCMLREESDRIGRVLEPTPGHIYWKAYGQLPMPIDNAHMLLATLYDLVDDHRLLAPIELRLQIAQRQEDMREKRKWFLNHPKQLAV
jgi:hypothetical protein